MRIDYGQAMSDVLTSVLNTLQFKGQVFCYGKFTKPWGIRMKRKECAHFHFFEHGEGYLELEETGEEVAISCGDLVILPRGGPHILRDSRKTRAVNIDRLLECRNDHVLRHGGGGAETSSVCGAFTFENQSGNPILPLLPEVIHVPGQKTGTWLESTLKLLAHEAQFPREGSGSIVGHVTGIIFIQAVREWIATQTQGQAGWLGALRDRQIGSALSLMHQKPAEQWTIAKLASEVGMSRSPFATKFTSLVGQPPLAYLTRWRMNLAAGYLRDDQFSIREIAERVGYESPAAFTNAFKRSFSVSPREYKEKQRPIVSPPLTKPSSVGPTYTN